MRLKSEQKRELDIQYETLAKGNDELVSANNELVSLIAQNKTKLGMCEENLENTASEVKVSKEDLHSTNTAIIEGREVLRDLEEQEQGLKSSISTHTDMLSVHQGEKERLESGLEELRAQYTEEKERLDSIDGLYLEKKRQGEEDLAKTSAKVLVKTQELNDIQQIMDIERREIASRKLALDERDKNLRIREVKASQDEASIQANAGLLNL